MIAPLRDLAPTRSRIYPRSGFAGRIARVLNRLQECTVCGRPVAIPAELAGKTVACSHCGGRFRAEAAPAVSYATASLPAHGSAR